MKAKIIIEKGSLGNDNVVLPTGIYFKKEVPLTKDFKLLLGFCTPFLENNTLMAYIEIKDEYLNLFPSICVQVEHSILKQGWHVYTKSKLLSVSLCTQPNVDESIKSLKDQINDNNLPQSL